MSWVTILRLTILVLSAIMYIVSGGACVSMARKARAKAVERTWRQCARRCNCGEDPQTDRRWRPLFRGRHDEGVMTQDQEDAELNWIDRVIFGVGSDPEPYATILDEEVIVPIPIEDAPGEPTPSERPIIRRAEPKPLSRCDSP